jgi:predicted permease
MRWIQRLLHKSRSEQQLHQELQFHLDRQIANYLAAGIAPEEARRRARLDFGGLERVKEEVRDTRRGNFLETLFQDLGYGMRMLKKSPSLTAIVVITLAFGIGVNTAIFSVLNGWLFRPLPVRAPEQIAVLVFSQDHNGSNFSYADLLDFQKQPAAFSDLFAYGLSVAGLSANGTPREFGYSSVTGNYFSALGVTPALGRFFLPSEGETPGTPLLVVLGNSYWQKNFGSDPGVVGKQVLVNGQPATIIGVTPKDFHGTLFAFDMDGYLTLNAMAMDKGSGQFWTDRRERRLTVLGRLKPNLSTSQATISSEITAQRLAAQYPSTNRDVTIRVIPERLARPAAFVSSFVPVIAGLFFILAALVLLLACMNVANILLARSVARRREMAIRSALGAGRSRLIRQMLTESLLLSLLGGIVGVLFAKWSIGASGSFLHSVTTTTNFAYKMDCGLDWRVFSYTLAAAILTGVSVGLFSALRASPTDVNEVLQGSARGDSFSRGGSRIRSALVVVQVAGSLTLLIVAGLFVRSLRHTEHMYLGFEPDHVLNVMLDPHQIGYDEVRTKAFYRELEDRARTMSGVQSASLSFAVPLGIPGHVGFISVEGHPVVTGQQPPETSFNTVDPAYFATMRIPILRGRTFAESDNETALQVAIVNQTMASRFWPNEDPVGKRFRWTGESGPYVEVVGLAQDGQYFFLSPDSRPYFYVPLAQDFSSRLSLQLRSSIASDSLILAIQEQVRALAPDLPIIDLSTMQQTVRGLGGLFVFRLAASLAAALGFLGLSLAVVGVYGIVSFGMIQRTHEVGIRVALGASRKDILKLALGSGFALISSGVALGVISAGTLTHPMSKLLIGVTGIDPATYALAVAVIYAVALLASWVPARRATKMDPLVALRYE